jgi:hypothetical protein
MRPEWNGWFAFGVIWVLTLAPGFALLWAYKMRPGEAAGAPVVWPMGTRIARNRDRATLVLFAHPQCPCTRASVAELARLMSRSGDRLGAIVVFLRPSDVSGDWDSSDLWRSASTIPGVTIVRDDDGVEAARFRASTSGATVLYDMEGRLLFSGGITSARGHEGDSAGLQRIDSLLRTGKADRSDAPVYGCSMRHEVRPALAVQKETR